MHWYDKEGTPKHFVASKNGKLRASTLRDARKFGWMPSVTSVLDIMAKPGLDQWKINKAIDSAINLDRLVTETDAEYSKRILAHSKEESTKASESGTRIHTMLEKAFKNEEEPKGEDKLIYNSVKSLLDVNCGEQGWISEKSFCHKELGYGGKVDLYSNEWVIDFKTKESIEDKKQLAYDAMAHQLIGYNKGIPHYMEHREDYWKERRIANVFISADNPGHVVFHEWPLDKHELYWNVFASALDLWKHMKNYRPEEFNNERN